MSRAVSVVCTEQWAVLQSCCGPFEEAGVGMQPGSLVRDVLKVVYALMAEPYWRGYCYVKKC